VAEALRGDAGRVRLFEVVGSSVADPSRPDAVSEQLSRLPWLAYRRVVLGFVVEGSRSRWLTDSEISAGVVAAIEGDAEHSVVGTVVPWSLRP
jgi:hypothetical protein